MHKRTAYKILLGAILLIVASCSTAPVQEQMVINPRQLTFHSWQDSLTVSITHTCTCPFSWTSSVSPPSPWLIIPADTSGDHTAILFRVDRTQLHSDTVATVHIISNNYGTDSINVEVLTE